MYWLLNVDEQRQIRKIVADLTNELSTIIANPQDDQLFPFVGRKDKYKSECIIRHLSSTRDVICDPFSGSGINVYAAATLERQILANEWEPYTNRISSAPWRLPNQEELDVAYQSLVNSIKPRLDSLYSTRCPCGHEHVLHSLFFDRMPLKYVNISHHERLGPNDENVTYRGIYRCPRCGRKEKFFDDLDARHMAEIEQIPVNGIFDFGLIENSRINLSREFTVYGRLFPHRSKLALVTIWDAIQNLPSSLYVRMYLEDVFLSILPQAKYKDYRSKSQDLHCPTEMLREVNLLYVYQDQYVKRLTTLRNYPFAQVANDGILNNPIETLDFRDFLDSKTSGSVNLVFTDPPWTDGTAYFERAQLYHPWLNYDLKLDDERLEKEMVVTNAPSRRGLHDSERWWRDLEELFRKSYQVLNPNNFMALYFRPIPAALWLANLNKMKLIARRTGFEPLLSIDIGSSDPSMRIQQSASYVFSKDVVMLFLRLEPEVTRKFYEDYDLDQVVYQTAESVQERLHSPFTYTEWRRAFSEKIREMNLFQLDSPRYEDTISGLFFRYCDEVSNHNFLPKIQTPFSGQLFDTPAIERLFSYVPQIIDELTRDGGIFTYDQFLLGLAEFVENGTRELISSIQSIDIRSMIEIYAEPMNNGVSFQRRPLPQLPHGISHVLALDPYDFEAFIANLFEAQGYTSIGLLGRSGDRGVDIAGIDPQGRSVAIQCKRYRNNVSADPIQRLHSYAMTRGAQRKILVTTSDFTRQAVDEARNTETELIRGEELEVLIATFLPGYFAA